MFSPSSCWWARNNSAQQVSWYCFLHGWKYCLKPTEVQKFLPSKNGRYISQWPTIASKEFSALCLTVSFRVSGPYFTAEKVTSVNIFFVTVITFAHVKWIVWKYCIEWLFFAKKSLWWDTEVSYSLHTYNGEIRNMPVKNNFIWKSHDPYFFKIHKTIGLASCTRFNTIFLCLLWIHCIGGSWNWTQDNCNACVAVRCTHQLARSHWMWIILIGAKMGPLKSILTKHTQLSLFNQYHFLYL